MPRNGICLGTLPIAISIPVHEEPDVILDQIENIRHFVPDAILVLHVSGNFSYRTPGDAAKVDALGDLAGVYVNPRHLPSAWGDIAYLHLANFRYLDGVADFDHFVLHASNDAFVSVGAEVVMADRLGGVLPCRHGPDSPWVQAQPALNDPDLTRMLEYLGAHQLYGAQTEGSFYSRDLFRDVADIVDRFYRPEAAKGGYAREEVFFPTLALNLAEKQGALDRFFPHTYVYSSVVHETTMTEPGVDAIRSQVLTAAPDVPYLAVKRVNRRHDDGVRQYIRNLAIAEREAFVPGCKPFELAERKATTFFHHPHWHQPSWTAVLGAYLQAFDAADDVSLALCLDPAQGPTLDEVTDMVLAQLAACGRPQEALPAVTLVPEALRLQDLAGLYAAADVVVPGGDPTQVARALHMGKRCLADLSPETWRDACLNRV